MSDDHKMILPTAITLKLYIILQMRNERVLRVAQVGFANYGDQEKTKKNMYLF